MHVDSGCAAELLVCKGPCLKAFHPACLGTAPSEAITPASQVAWFCPECVHGRVRCFVCGEFGAGFEDPTVRKCSLGVCGRFYHIRWAFQLCAHLQLSYHIPAMRSSAAILTTFQLCAHLQLSYQPYTSNKAPATFGLHMGCTWTRQFRQVHPACVVRSSLILWRCTHVHADTMQHLHIM